MALCLFIIGCTSNKTPKIERPKAVLRGNEITNHTSIIDLPTLSYIQKDTINSHLAIQYDEGIIIHTLLEPWFNGFVLQNMDANKLIKLKCYRVNKELYKIANKDFTCTSKQRDSIINTLNSRLLVEFWYLNGKVLSKVYDSTVMKTYGIKY